MDVEAAFSQEGWPVVTALWWNGERLAVVETGRRWFEDEARHLLARVADGRVFEVRTNSVQWWGRIVSEPPHMA